MDSSELPLRTRILSVIEVASFGPAATTEAIAQVETAIGVQFPCWLREIYLACDGFRGPTNTRYLYPLGGRDGVAEFTLFVRAEEWAPEWLDRAIIFSENGIGGSLTVHWASLDGRLIEWCYGDGDEFIEVDGDLFSVWSREQQLWNELDAD